jgi:hypothetical protein
MATITARMTARKGLSTALPKLLPGELGLATDIQKTFIGQEPVVGSTDLTASNNTTAVVEFMSSAGYPVDLDEITTTDLAYGITVTDNEQATPTVTEIPGASITFVDQKATFTHPLKDSTGVTPRAPDGNETFSLWYNKEVGYVAEAFVNPAQTLTFTATASATPQTTGVEFLCENKESVIIDYTLSHAGTPSASRRGTLSILLDNDANTPSTSSIKDEYDISTGAIPVKFSLTDNGADKFILNFETTDTVNAHTFTYIQKSFK